MNRTAALAAGLAVLATSPAHASPRHVAREAAAAVAAQPGTPRGSWFEVVRCHALPGRSRCTIVMHTPHLRLTCWIGVRIIARTYWVGDYGRCNRRGWVQPVLPPLRGVRA